ncbi:MAG: hypothetical protein RL685_7400 [Pseudomonadota bacterium]
MLQVPRTPHFVERNYRGEWSALALRSADGQLGHAHSLPGRRAAEHVDTPLLAECPLFRDALAALACPIGAVRLLLLGPGSEILEHTDHDLGVDGSMLRLHIPIQTHPDVEFFVEDERVVMDEGECWYIDTSLRHRARNPTTQSRVHLVVDCELSPWLREQLTLGGLQPRQRDPFELRGIRQADLERVVQELRAQRSPDAERLALELERDLAVSAPTPGDGRY